MSTPSLVAFVGNLRQKQDIWMNTGTKIDVGHAYGGWKKKRSSQDGRMRAKAPNQEKLCSESC